MSVWENILCAVLALATIALLALTFWWASTDKRRWPDP